MSEGGPIQHHLLKSHRMAHSVVLKGDNAQAGKGNKIKITVNLLFPSASCDDASRNSTVTRCAGFTCPIRADPGNFLDRAMRTTRHTYIYMLKNHT